MDFSGAEVTLNNLGGQGPDTCEPVLRYHNVGHGPNGELLDLLITARGPYHSEVAPRVNGKSGYYGMIGLDENTEAVLNVQLIDAESSQPVRGKFYFSVLDLDTHPLFLTFSQHNGGGQESVTFEGFSEYFLTDPTEIEVRSNSDGSTSFYGTTVGNRADNPQDPFSMTEQQAARSVTVLFEDTSDFKMKLHISDLPGGGSRAFLIAGKSAVTKCGHEHNV